MLVYITTAKNTGDAQSLTPIKTTVTVVDGRRIASQTISVPSQSPAQAKMHALYRLMTESNLTGDHLDIVLDDNDLARTAERAQTQWALEQDHDTQWDAIFEAYSRRFAKLATFVGVTALSCYYREFYRTEDTRANV